jgi:hypothetical protein
MKLNMEWSLLEEILSPYLLSATIAPIYMHSTLLYVGWEIICKNNS